MQPLRLLSTTLVVSISLAGAVGCSSADSDASKATANGSSIPADPRPDDRSAVAADSSKGADPAVLEGRVVFHGPLPPPRKIVATKDVEYCGKHVGERQEVVVSESGGLAGAVVEIRGVDEPEGGWTWEHPDDGYVLRQKGCAFEPYLTVMPDGQQLAVFNDDPVSHNINTGLWNILQAAGSKEPLVRPVGGRRPIRVGCNIHSWMESWIYLVQSPFYAVTSEDGSFRVENVPPGKYRVTAWHPSLRMERASLEFSPAGALEHEFTFESPYDE